MSTVLLVEDDSPDRASLREILGRAGYAVHELARGLNAVEKSREIRPHVIVVGMALPDIDGPAVCRSLRADPTSAGLPLLIRTMPGRKADIVAGLEAGADDYLASDDAGEVVLARVGRLVRSRRLATLSVLNEQLAQVGRLVAGIVHEIRAPLTVIRGNAELMALELDPDGPAASLVEPILRSARTLQVRLDHLMAAVRTGPSAPGPVDVLSLLREAIGLFLKGTDPRRGKVVVEMLAEGTLPIVRADGGRMMQVVLNLLSNAHEAILADRDEGQVVVKASAIDDQGAVRVDILDDGPGIAPGHLERIFEPFFTTKDGGTGYGLYLSSEILREHGGRLSAENRDGRGACLTIWLPAY